MPLVIVATHGERLAEAFLESAAMIGGESENVKAITFVPGEGPDDLVKKYQALIQEKKPDSVLFLVDLFGGSPYNAAIRLADGKDNYDVVSGVNLPMVIEVLMAVEEGSKFEEIRKIALEVAADSVKTFSGFSLSPSDSEDEEEEDNEDYKKGRPTEGNMDISLLRIDSRLIHGQVATSWAKAVKCDAIFAISDEVANDDMRSRLLLQVAPAHLRSYVITVDKAIKVWHNPMYADRSVMWLVTKPADIVRLIEGGVNIKKVNVGGMTHREGCKLISKAVAVDKDDVAAFRKLNEMGVEMTIQQLAAHSPEPLLPALDKVSF